MGERAHFAHLLPLYAEAGISVTVVCEPDKRILFEGAGALVARTDRARSNIWRVGERPRGRLSPDEWWRGNKGIRNLSASSLSDIDPPDRRWRDHAAVRIPAASFLDANAYAFVEEYRRTLAHPIVLLHTHGNTESARKSVPNQLCPTHYRQLLDVTVGRIVLLD